MSESTTHTAPPKADPNFKTEKGYINYYPQMADELGLSTLATCLLVRIFGFRGHTAAATPRWAGKYLNVSTSTARTVYAELETKAYLIRAGKRGKAIRRKVSGEAIFNGMTFGDYYGSLKANPNVRGYQLFQEVWQQLGKSVAEYAFLQRIQKRSYEGVCTDTKAVLAEDTAIHERSAYNYLNRLEFHRNEKGHSKPLIQRNRDTNGDSKRDGEVRPTAYYHNVAQKKEKEAFNTNVKAYLRSTFERMGYDKKQIRALKVEKIADELFQKFVVFMREQQDWTEEISWQRFLKLLQYLVKFAHGAKKPFPLRFDHFERAMIDLLNYLYHNPDAAAHPPDQLIAAALENFKT